MSVTYQPPYDSPIEDAFAYHFAKYANDDVQLACQVPITTICGLFIIDFVVQSPKIGRIAIECDGKAFHKESRDEWRDAMILGSKAVDVVYRIRGCDIVHHIDDVLYCLSRLELGVFSKRGEVNLTLLASNEAKKLYLSKKEDLHGIHYENEWETGSLRIETRRSHIPEGQRRFWKKAYEFALSIGGGNIDEVIDSYRQSI